MTVRHLGPVDVCPGCQSPDFQIEERSGAVLFRCLGCETYWRYELGYVWPVDPASLRSTPDLRRVPG